MNDTETGKYPMLTELLRMRNLQLQAMYTVRDIATLFNVTVRAIQSRVSSGQLASRDLPGRIKFLSVDLEAFLNNSKKKVRAREHWTGSLTLPS